MKNLENSDYILLIAFSALLTLPLLYIFRYLDDNTLTSWKWVFTGVGIGKVFLYLLAGVFISFFLSKTPYPERYPYLFLLFLSFVAVLPLWREPELILDASRYFLQAKHLKLYGFKYFFVEWGRKIEIWTDLPLLPLLYGSIFKYLGELRVFIQFLNTLFFSLTVVLTFSIGKSLWDEETGFYAGLLLMGIPYLLTQVPLMLIDVPTMFLLTLSIFVFLKAIKKGGSGWVLISSFAVVFTLFSKYSTWLMLLVLPLTAFAYGVGRTKTTLRRLAAVAVIAGVLSAVVSLAKYDVFLKQINTLWTFQWTGLRRWHESYISTFFFQIHPFISISALYAIYRAIRKKDRRFLIAGWFVIFVFSLQVQRIRYILPLFPLFTLMASYGLNIINDKEVKRFIGFCIVSSSLVILLIAYFPFFNRTSMANLQNAGKFLNTLEREAVEVYVLPQTDSSGNTEAAIPILDLYTSKRLFYNPGLQPLHPGEGVIEKSSLRFTWNFKRPGFYSKGDDEDLPIILISGEKITIPPHGLRLDTGTLETLKEFVKSTGTFKYRTFVTIYTYTHEFNSLSRTGQ